MKLKLTMGLLNFNEFVHKQLKTLLEEERPVVFSHLLLKILQLMSWALTKTKIAADTQVYISF